MKQFLIIGNGNAVTYKEIFPLIKENKLWLGASSFNCGMYFQVPDNYEYAKTYKFDRERNGVKVMRVSSICWFTNLDHDKRHRPIDLYKHYSNEYKHYDNYDAIEVSKVCEIPMDYDGVMGVPITFLDKYCPEQFEIVDINPHFFSLIEQGIEKPKQLSLKSYNMKDPYARILIRHRKAQLMEYGKKFIVLGNMNAITCKEIFPYIKADKLWFGPSISSGDRKFEVPADYPLEAAGCGIDENGVRYIRVKGVRWFTNLDHEKRNRPLDLYKHYSNEYKHYDNYDAIEVGKVCDIPMDYDGVMGVPITFLDKYCPEQFEIVDAREYGLTDRQKNKSTYLIKDADGSIDGKATYVRIAIRHRKAQLMEYGKKFIIIGPMNAVTYKEIFPLIKSNQLWLGQNAKGGSRKGNSLGFVTNNGETKDVSSWWFTNLSNERRNTPLDLYKHYSNEYKHYDNYDAIEVSKSCDVPMDYDGVMGVPISFLMFHCPEQFEILGIANSARYIGDFPCYTIIDGVKIYNRILIRHRKAQLMEYGKKFIIIGNGNAVTYKEVFPLIKENKLWLGNKNFSGGMDFVAGENYDSAKCKHPKYDEKGNIIINVMMCVWFTNLEHNKRHRPIDLYKHYSNEYKHYDNYDAIEVGKVCEIPMDYDGVMGVPITFLDKYCPEQFEILGTSDRGGDGLIEWFKIPNQLRYDAPTVDGIGIYKRLFIRHRK